MLVPDYPLDCCSAVVHRLADVTLLLLTRLASELLSLVELLILGHLLSLIQLLIGLLLLQEVLLSLFSNVGWQLRCRYVVQFLVMNKDLGRQTL